MNILFVSYWGLGDGLTSATVIPHLKILSQFQNINKIILCTIERSESTMNFSMEKVKHVPLIAKDFGNVFINKVSDFVRFSKKMGEIADTESIDLIVCRSSLAGALGYLVWKKKRIPYVVESFEPHAGYMLDSSTWRVYDPRYGIQKYFERRQKKTAKWLLPVSHNYEMKLRDELTVRGIIETMPCCVSMRDFAFDSDKRNSVRHDLGISGDSVVGIYVGKYGDIYYDAEAFDLYQKAFAFFGENFRLILLSKDPLDRILEAIRSRGIAEHCVFIRSVQHHQVRDFLCAADFAFSTIRPSVHRKYCSPVKNGEYWANGLPILTEDGIGDDSDIIQAEGGGVILSLKTPEQSFEKLLNLIKIGRKQLGLTIQALAFKHRRMEIVEETYKRMIASFLSEK